MIENKNLDKFTLVLLIIALLICIKIVYLASLGSGGKVPKYEEEMFGEHILTIDIEVDEEEWQGLLDNAMEKEYISGDLIINGKRFSTVGIRTKGNSSLSQVARMEDSNRYSLQFKSNKFVKGQTFYGLDSFCINNITGDSTYMKDYLSYDLMNYIGVDTPLTNYASVTVNGEDFGFYIALERYDKSFLDRVYNTSGGELYNVKIVVGQRDNFMQGGDMEMPEFNNNRREDFNHGEFPPITLEDGEVPFLDRGGELPADAGSTRDGFGARAGFGGMENRGGGSLVYTDDSIRSYASIFDNAVFSKNSDKDKQRVIIAIKNLNEGMDLEKYIDLDKTLRYLAAHTVLVNLDSYSSGMAQNYYLYEKDGRLTILPWDYNYAFGGFQMGNSTDVINFPIDSPVSGVSMEDRPLINKLLELDDYREKYHEYLQDIVDGYFLNGLFEERVNDLNNKINKYVKNDSSSFISYEEYESSLPVLIELGNLRAESINGQLNGSLPSTTEGQETNRDLLVDGSNINLSSLGNMGGGFGARGEIQEGKQEEGNDNIFREGNFNPGQGRMPNGQGGPRGGREEIPNEEGDFRGERERFPTNRDNFQDNRNLTSETKKEYMGLITFSVASLVIAFGFIFKRKKNY